MKIKLPTGNSQRAHVDVELLSAYLDGQVAGEERRCIEAHLGSCVACQHELKSLRQTVVMLHALPRVATPRAFTLSEAQVGIRRPAGQPAWLGGMLRGIAAVSAIALVAVIGTVLLRRPSWEPPQLAAPFPASAPSTVAAVAKVQPTQEIKAREVNPPAAQQAPSATTLKAQPSTKAPEPTAPKAAEKLAEKAPTTAAQAAAIQADKAVAAAPTAAPAAAPRAGAVQATATAMPALARAQETGAAATAVPAPTRAQETGAAATAGKSAPALSAAAVAPTAQVQLPTDTVLSYADAYALLALDSDGARTLATATGITTPTISEDRAWVVYRLTKGDGVEVWAVPWSGGDAKLLLTERELNSELPQGYRERRIQDVRWVKRMLAITTLATPATADTPPILELWRVDVESGSRKLLARTDARYRPIAAPDGARLAFFRREPEKAPDGSLWVIGADGSAERVALRFPAWPDQRVYDGQISWLPDSSGFWAAIPDAGLDDSSHLNGLTLYRTPMNGDARSVAHIDASEAHWSPDGLHLAYVRLTSDASGPRELYLAAADGANPQLYATITRGRFIGWSPDSTHFLYQEGAQLMLGARGQKAQRLASGVTEPRWVGAGQILYLADGAGGWVLHGIDGKITSLAALPANTTLDSIAP